MPKKRCRPEQIIAELRKAEVELAEGLNTGAVCRKLAISEQKLFPVASRGWRPSHGSAEAPQAALDFRHPGGLEDPILLSVLHSEYNGRRIIHRSSAGRVKWDITAGSTFA